MKKIFLFLFIFICATGLFPQQRNPLAEGYVFSGKTPLVGANIIPKLSLRKRY